MRASLAVLPFVMLVLAACNDAAEPRDGGDNEGQPAQAALALEGEGLRLVLRSSGSTRPLPFGTTRDSVVQAVYATGVVPVDSGAAGDCGLDYLTWSNRLNTNFREGALVGWAVRDPGLTTMAGIGVGSSRAALDSVHQAEVSTTSLGNEFAAGGMAGVLSPEERIEVMWAGEVCLAR